MKQSWHRTNRNKTRKDAFSHRVLGREAKTLELPQWGQRTRPILRMSYHKKINPLPYETISRREGRGADFFVSPNSYIECQAFNVGVSVRATGEGNSPKKRRPCARSYGSRSLLRMHQICSFLCHDAKEFSTGKTGRAQKVQLAMAS